MQRNSILAMPHEFDSMRFSAIRKQKEKETKLKGKKKKKEEKLVIQKMMINKKPAL
jgi:hypothetical protein